MVLWCGGVVVWWCGGVVELWCNEMVWCSDGVAVLPMQFCALYSSLSVCKQLTIQLYRSGVVGWWGGAVVV